MMGTYLAHLQTSDGTLYLGSCRANVGILLRSISYPSTLKARKSSPQRHKGRERMQRRDDEGCENWAK